MIVGDKFAVGCAVWWPSPPTSDGALGLHVDQPPMRWAPTAVRCRRTATDRSRRRLIENEPALTMANPHQ
jgi:hypothetical protein